MVCFEAYWQAVLLQQPHLKSSHLLSVPYHQFQKGKFASRNLGQTHIAKSLGGMAKESCAQSIASALECDETVCRAAGVEGTGLY